jgi:hypothetical protein
MSFWNLSDNTSITEEEKAGTFESGGGDFEPIPAGTQLKACIDDAAWEDYEGDFYINVTWSALEGEFKNRKVFQKIRVRDNDHKKRDKALRMLAAIDANAGGKLMASGQEPDDNALQSSLVNKPMAIKVDVWEMNDRKGNWVQKVAPLASLVESSDDFQDDVPF